MKIIERRIVEQQWYETEYSKTGWDSHGWTMNESEWIIVEHLDYDKFYNPILAIAEKETEI